MISIECYQGIPLDYESFLIMRYDSFFTNCRYFEVYYQDYGINHMLVSKDSTLIELLVFGIKDETAYYLILWWTLIRESFQSSQKKVFELFPSILKIEISASYRDYSLSISYLSFKSYDQMLKLPLTIED